ncbi:MAG TPA: imidazole glycerol phosphate synthase subunit HisH [Terrimesophilobacter sp.]|nr:imidazole glycerol phosphate synthase subunit HisH [Terrimesophilobacter sp.]
MAIEVEVLDLGINNLASLCRGFTEAGAIELRTVSSGDESRGADLLVLPGVGAYGAAMQELAVRGLDKVVAEHVSSGGHLFGVCLGMQLLGTGSEESPSVAGLDFIPGQVRKLVSTSDARVPNVGWTGLTRAKQTDGFATLDSPLDFYFVHSFSLAPDDASTILATSDFGGQDFVSGVLSGNVLGFQFHPEKSSRSGKLLLADVLGWANG